MPTSNLAQDGESTMSRTRIQPLRPARAAALITVVLATAFLTMAVSASADISFGAFGSGAGQTSAPRGVATDWSNGNVYVADNANNRIDVFDSTGSFIRAFGWGVADGSAKAEVCTATCQAGIAGSGAGQLDGPRGIAVDNDPASVAFHDVYVYDGSNRRVQRFHPDGEFVLGFGSAGSGAGQFEAMAGIGAGPGGTVYVADVKGGGPFTKRVQKFKPSGELIEQLPLADSTEGNIAGFAVDSTGSFYVANVGGVGVRKYDSAGVFQLAFNPSFNNRAVAVDPAGHVYVADLAKFQGAEALPPTEIKEYDSSGTQLRAFGYGSLERAPRPPGIAFYEGGGELFASQGEEGGADSRIVRLSLPAVGPIALPNEGETVADPIGNVKATLNATVNPEGKASSVLFEYVDDATYQKDIAELGAGHGFDHAKSTAAVAAGSDFKLHVASALAGCTDSEKELPEGKCLVPETKYRFRARATNADAPAGNLGPEAEFTTRAPIEFGGLWSSEVATDSATLSAEVNPLGIPAKGRFEYVDDAIYQKDIAELGAGHGFDHATGLPASGSLDFGAGEAPLKRSVQLEGLSPATAYRYRVIAEDPFATVPSPEGAFRTFARPVALEGCANQAFRAGASAKLPDCRAFELVSPFDKLGSDIGVLLSGDASVPAELPQASPDGERLTYSTYRAFADSVSAPYTSQYLASREAGAGWANHAISPPREGGSVNEPSGFDTHFQAFSADLCDGWLLYESNAELAPGAVPGYDNLYRRHNCGEEGYEALTTVKPPLQKPLDYFPEVEGFSTDATHTVFQAGDKLLKEASGETEGGKPIRQLYESFEGALTLVSTLPNGVASPLGSSAGTATLNRLGFRHASINHAVSVDGSRVFWTASADDGKGPGTLYLRLNAERKQSKVVSGECSEAERACTLPVSESVGGPGSTGPAQFWTASADGSRAIFSFAGLGALNGNLYGYDLATRTSSLIAGKVQAVVGASENASRLYLISEEALAPGAVAGEANLYLYEAGGGFALVATLAHAGTLVQGGSGGLNCTYGFPDPTNVCTRVSPDGSHLAFVSLDSLVGGYDNRDAASGKPALEVYLYEAGAEGGEGKLICASCNPSGSRPAARMLVSGPTTSWVAAVIRGQKGALHPSRYLSADGQRLFFESFDSLSPSDANGRADVYQWEAPGKGDCTEASLDFSSLNEGCISLISSGESAQDSEFVDASESGDDVFFKTQSGLVPQDEDLVDIYDARVGGGLPEPPGPPAACEGEACQGQILAPNDPTPASASFKGAGNLAPEAPRCAKGKVRRRGRCVARKARHRSHKSKRANPNRRAGR